MRVTLEEFYEELETLKDKLDWKLEKNKIRADYGKPMEHCPQTAVSFIYDKRPNDFTCIWHAADKNKDYNPEIRKRLLQCLDLKEVE